MAQDAFNAAMNASVPDAASCTTCTFDQNFSNYWTQLMYFRARNGTFKRVPQIANQYLEGANGGMTVYYVSPDDASVNITAFRPVGNPSSARALSFWIQAHPFVASQGFRMLVGDSNARTSSGGCKNSFRCYTGKDFQPT